MSLPLRGSLPKRSTQSEGPAGAAAASKPQRLDMQVLLVAGDVVKL
jgi:hypothetical protein